MGISCLYGSQVHKPIVEWYVPRWVDIENRLLWVPKLRHGLASVLPCWNYTGEWDLSPEQVKEWAILDTFDALSAWYDCPQRPAAMERACQQAQLRDIHVRLGGNGILVTAQKPS